MAQIAYLTICTHSHIGYAITLAKSLRAAEPQSRLLVYLADSYQDALLPMLDEIEFVHAAKIAVDGYDDMAGRYKPFELSTALKAPCVLDAILRLGAEAVVYLDSDILVLQPFKMVKAALEDGYDCVLTPHITQPTISGEFLADTAFLTAGTFNMGFAAFSNREPAIAFLKWWAEKKKQDCTINISRGIFADQTYCNLAPAFISRLLVLRSHAVNIAYWNFLQRSLELNADGVILTTGEPACFAHFSGIDLNDPNRISRHCPNLSPNDAGVFGTLFSRYFADLKENDAIRPGGFSSIPYGFSKPVPEPAAIPDNPAKPLARKSLRGRIRSLLHR